MSGYETVLFVDSIRARAAKLGFKLCRPRFAEHDRVALRPVDAETLPVYSHDAELWVGTLQELKGFLDGIEWARNYDHMLRVSDDKKRESKEQAWRNQNLVNLLKHGPVKSGAFGLDAL